jgi:hypothetical protein
MGKFPLSFILAGAVMSAGTITTYTDATAFGTAVGAVSVDDVTSTSHFPILGLMLNSFTDLPGIGIAPGDILPGVTYSTDIGATANESGPFNIAAAAVPEPSTWMLGASGLPCFGGVPPSQII